MATSKIVLFRGDAEDFARLTLSEIATRAPSKHQKAPLVSAHMARQTDPNTFADLIFLNGLMSVARL